MDEYEDYDDETVDDTLDGTTDEEMSAEDSNVVPDDEGEIPAVIRAMDTVS